MVDSTPSDLLAIYLTDHLAGASAGTRRMKRLAEAESDATDAEALAGVVEQIEQERVVLADLIRSEGIGTRPLKAAAARVAEAVGTLKTNGRIWSRSPLTTLIELELMQMGVTAKLAMWETLENTHLASRYDFAALIAQSHAQLDVLRDAHALRTDVVAAAAHS